MKKISMILKRLEPYLWGIGIAVAIVIWVKVWE